MDLLSYLYLPLLVYITNALPAFMPPTWTILVFFLTTRNMWSPAVVVLGALAALAGRMTLFYFAKSWQKHLPKKMSENYEELGKILGRYKVLSLPLFLVFAFYPLPSNQLFIMAGLSKLKANLLAVSFLGGRILSYSFWVGSAKVLDKSVEEMFISGLDPKRVIFVLFTMILLIALPGLVPWKKYFSRLNDLYL